MRADGCELLRRQVELHLVFFDALRDPSIRVSDLAALDSSLAGALPEWRALAETAVKYEGYIRRQDALVGRFRSMEEKRIPPDFPWDALVGVSSEAREKLARIRPLSVGQASRIPGASSRSNR